MKKLFAILLAVAMIMGLALTASAAETTLSDVDSAAFWGAHSEGVEITEEGVEITFTNTTYADAANNWNGPMWILYTGDEGKVNGAGYAEYWVERGDVFGWAGAALKADKGLANDAVVDTAEANAANLAAAGVTHELTYPADWAAWLTEMKAGISCKLVAKRVGGNVVATLTVGEVVSTVTVPCPADKTAYISLSGEMAKLTNIKVKTPDAETPVDPSNPGTGDVLSVVIALAAVSAFGAAIVLKKKEF